MTANLRQRTDIGISTGWKRRSSDLDRGLSVTAACFILLYVAPAVSTAELLPISSSCIGRDYAVAGVGGSNNRTKEVPNVSKHGGNGNTCLTAVCNDTATMILNNMDRSVEPCDNFYRYVCGGYINSIKLSAAEDSRSSLHNVNRQLYEQLIAIVKAEIKPNEPRAYGLVKKYYKSCMNESAIEARGVQPLLATLRRIGGWPLIEGPSWNESNFDWTKAVDELRESAHHIQVFMDIRGAQNPLDYDHNAVTISPPDRVKFDDSITNVIDNVTVAARVDFLLDIAMRLGVQDNPGIREQLREAYMFAFNLESFPSLHMLTELTIPELSTKHRSIPWREYINKRMPSPASMPVSGNMILDRPIYFDRLNKQLSNTSKRVLANYIGLITVLESMQYLNREMLAKAQQSSTTVASSRVQMCMKSVFSLSFAIESMYASRHVSADTNRDVTSIMDDVRKGARELLETTSWLDTITKSRVLQKLDTMSGYIAYADQPSNDTLDKIYESLEIDEEHYYENTHKVSRFNVHYSLDNLRQPVKKLGPSFEITDVAANYRRDTNTFALTPGMLQDKFFGNDRPRFINYGAIGSIIGHEMFHAFDNTGLRYNENGEEIPVGMHWWEPSSETEFSERAQCMVDQYNNYTVQEVGGVHINGTMTLDENIADVGGMRGTYLAYKNWVETNVEEPNLPGIDMPPYQLFWISTAIQMCEKALPQAILNHIYHDQHSLPEFRIIGAMSNIPEFATDFKCPVGSNMNPLKKCSIW